jgi:serine/threonine protein kinase/predicted ATPase
MSTPDLLAGRFEVHDAIGEGGMGLVLKGLDRQTGRAVAIKTLRADVSAHDPVALDRFQREAEMLRQLDHPNIIKVLGAFEQDDVTYIVMEFAAGGSLAALLRREGPVSIRRLLPLALDIADAMTRVHRLGILHRDIKPENILLADDGSARLSDFGIAYLAGANALTQAGGVVGTMQYLSPEALCGEPLDARTDVWAFGAVLFELLAGRAPFRNEAVGGLILSILNDPVPDLEALRPDVPVALVDLIYRMLDKEVRSRIRSVRLVGAELEALLHETGVEDRRLSTGGPEPAVTEHRPAQVTPRATTSRKGTPNNLPAQTTPFVGRATEMQELARLMDDRNARLLTVLGAGGSGKTRIVQELGAQQLSKFSDGVFFVSLAPLRDPEHVVTTTGDAIGLVFKPGVPHRQQLLAQLSEQKVLLVMDNFEHLLEAANLTTDILTAAPDVRIVVTSRERLGLQDETVFRLDGIAVPDPAADASVLRANASVELFLQSARRAWPAFAPSDSDLSAIATICRAVGGSPLAILLAASWVESLTVAEIAEEIRRSLDFLETDLRHVEARHRSMRAVFDASWQRLGAEEQRSLARMSVFRGGFMREAATDVAGASLRVLSTLVRQSLIVRDPQSGRYSMHELLRQYAEGKLAAAADDQRAAARAHADYYSAFLHALESTLYGLDKSAALAKIEREIDNIRAAWDWSVEHGHLSAIGQALTSLAAFYGLRTLNEEAVNRFSAGLAVVRAIPEQERPLELELGLQVRAAVSLMNLKGYGDPEVGAAFTRAHELCDRLGPSRLIAPVMFGLWAFYIISANHVKAAKFGEQLLEIGNSANDSVLEIGGHHSSAGSAASMGRLAEACHHAERVMQLYRPEYDPFIITFFADHSASAARGWHVAALNAMGQLDRARDVSRAMREFFEQLGHGQTHAQGLMFQFLHAGIRRDSAEEVEIARALKRAGELHGLPVYTMFGDWFHACAIASPATIETLAGVSMALREGVGFKAVTIGMTVMRQAELLLAKGDFAAALARIEEAIAWITAVEEHFFEADAHRVRGDVLAAAGDEAGAEASYQTAIEIARGQGARLFELRATTALGKLWQRQGRLTEAHEATRAIYDSFSEGFDATDLLEAKALIEAIELVQNGATRLV